MSDDYTQHGLFQAQQQFTEFVPQNYVTGQQVYSASPASSEASTNSDQLDSPPQVQAHIPYSDPFMTGSTLQTGLTHGITGLDGQTQINPFSSVATATGQPFYQDPNVYKHPLNYHLYASVGPRRETMLSYQRASADFFIPDNVREDLQKKSEAALQVFANSTLPHTVEHFHSLVALDHSNQRVATTFGYPSWIYKATSSKDGHTYALRRIEGFRLTNEQAIRSFQGWKRVNSASVVRVHDAFTGRWFGDSSLIVVTDYHPLAQTLQDKHFQSTAVPRGSKSSAPVPQENELWGYLLQLANALKTIHEAGLAAQTVTASKVLLTSKNRLRLNGCGVLDITQFEQRRPVTDLQRQDLQSLGRLILNVAVRNQAGHQNPSKSLDFVSRTYSERFRVCLGWLLFPPASTDPSSPNSDQQTSASSLTDYTVNNLLTNIADKVVTILDSALHQEDELTNNLMKELENGRLVRLLTKLNIILERPDISLTSTTAGSSAGTQTAANQPSSAWSETGERYYLKLFRDYVFHQVDHEGRPVLNLGHVVTCLNKLDAGVDELVQLVSRDEQNLFVISYREVKRGLEAAWAEIGKAAQGGSGRR